MLLSIVIPTRNRAGLLRYALAAATAHPSDDLEIVVSDNASSDHTREIATGTGDPRVRYERSQRPLAQPDSWEFAVAHAQGDWVTVQGDDDALVPSFPDRFAALVADGDTASVGWREAWYYDAVHPPVWLAPEQANRITIDPFSGEVAVRDSPAVLRDTFRLQPSSPPGFFNAAVHRSTIETLRARFGRVFGAPDPYVTSGVAVLLQEPRYRWVDLPLTIRGIAEATLSLNFVHNTRDVHDGVKEFDEADLFTLAPLRERTLATLVAESLLRMKAALPQELAAFDLDPVRYFVTTRKELDDPRRRADAGAAIDEWKRTLLTQDAEVRRAVRSELRHSRGKDAARRLVRRVKGRFVVPDDAAGGTRFACVNGAAAGFEDLRTVAAWLDNEVLPAMVPA